MTNDFKQNSSILLPPEEESVLPQDYPQTPITKKQLREEFERIVTEIGGDSHKLTGAISIEIMQTTAKLIRDKADEGELKLISKSLKELRNALKIFRKYKGIRKISIFGSARLLENTPTYTTAKDFSCLMAKENWMVITGAGNGVMRAGNQGAGTNHSFGLSIQLPFETSENEFIANDSKLINFRYFFTRKLNFIWHSSAVALFPGGFGTQDEGFEAITLVQTGKSPIVPIVMIEPESGEYWKAWDNYVRNNLLKMQMISEHDLNLYKIFNSTKEAVEHINKFYRNYHSQRYVDEKLVFRIKKPLSNKSLEKINYRFKDIIAEGKIEQGQAFNVEKKFTDLPRLYFTFTKHEYGRLRLLIDYINEMSNV